MSGILHWLAGPSPNATAMTAPPPAPPNASLQALQDAWNRYRSLQPDRGPQPQMPNSPFMKPQVPQMLQSATNLPPDMMNWGRLKQQSDRFGNPIFPASAFPQLAAPQMHPSSVRIDFHKPQEPQQE